VFKGLLARHMENRLRVVPLIEARTEAEDVKSFSFRDGICTSAIPGQYVMVWIPGVDEIPMALSTIDRGGISEITVRRVGTATQALHKQRRGSLIGIRGPFGFGFRPVMANCLLVGGGSGVASLTPLAELLAGMGAEISFVAGFRSRPNVFFVNRLQHVVHETRDLLVTTDDGSYGEKGFASYWAEKMLRERAFDIVYVCGPEAMMVKVFEETERTGIPLQASLERYIKCSVGLCGSCAIGNLRICEDGPVLDSDQLHKVIEEFGKLRLDPAGKPVGI